MFGWIITAAIALPLLVMAIFLLNGKGAFLIAGYNTMSSKERETYDEKALCKAVGWLLLLISVFSMFFPLSISLESTWLFWASFIPIMILPLGFVIYANTGNRFRKPVDPNAPPVVRKPMSRGKKVLIVIGIVLSAQLIIGIGVMIYMGERDPNVSIRDNNIHISALYGLDISFSDVTDITLDSRSMREIGIGSRYNGYATTGEALKGHFSSAETGQQLLFVYSSSAPTIRIEQRAGTDIFISFRNSETTEATYRELSSALP